MEIKRIFIISLFIIISLCAKPKRLYNLTETEFIEVSKETNNTKIKWLMIFYTNNYHDLDKFMDLIKEDVYSYYQKNKNIKFGFLEISSNNVKWLIHLLDIKSVPSLVLISNEKMYYYKYDTLSQENIIRFIDDKKSESEGHAVPEKITLFTKGKILYNFLINDLNDNFQRLLDKFNINFKWNNTLTILFIVLLMFLFFILEVFIIKLLCIRSNENVKEFDKDKKESKEKIIEKKDEIKKEKTE